MTEPQAQPTPPAAEGATTHAFEAEVESVLRLVIESLYSNREVFLRELLSNASDALDKLRFRALTEPALVPEGEVLRVRLEPDAAAGTLTIWDNGVGMTKAELQSHLGTIAKSGTRELVAQAKAAGGKADLSLIGRFGVGFYSAFLVATKVEVTSRAAGEREAWKWTSTGSGTFTIEPASRPEQGTSVVLHLKDDAKAELLRSWQLEELVKKTSDYLHFPIELRFDKEKEGAAEYRTINRGTALWQRSPSDVKDEEYAELYKHLAHDPQAPIAHKHFRAEGTTEFTGLLFLPAQQPFDLFDPDSKKGLRLYVKRVFVLEDAEEILPRWLRFLRGVVDSEDLPLNVSRELLQDSRLTRIIKKQVVRQALDMLDALAKDRPDDYAKFWRSFGVVLKEGLHFEPENAGRLKKLVRFESSTRDGLVSLEDAKAGMKEGQPAIYYALGQSRKQLESSPHLEGLRARGYEVLLLTDPVDHWAIQGLSDVDGVKLVSATSGDIDLGEKKDPAAKEESDAKLKELRDRVRTRLQETVSEVRTSERLTGSPACLVVPEGGISPHLERLVRATQKDLAMPAQKRILELNPTHPIVLALASMLEKDATSAKIDDWIDLLFEQALVAEGSPLDDPGAFVRRVNALFEEAATRNAG